MSTQEGGRGTRSECHSDHLTENEQVKHQWEAGLGAVLGQLGPFVTKH